MKHTYKISGMTCNGCRSHVEKTWNEMEGVEKASVDLNKAEAEIEMEKHIPLEIFQNALKHAGGKYQIGNSKSQIPSHIERSRDAKLHSKQSKISNLKSQIYYCPMHCEGEKTYEKPGDCPVCGMDLVAQPVAGRIRDIVYTCPMHPEIVQDEPGDCPICGMDLVARPVAGQGRGKEASGENKSYLKLLRKF